MTTTTTKKTTLRTNFGSHAKIDKVYSYDPANGTASVRLDAGGYSVIDTMSLSELEALDASGRFVPVDPIVRRMAGEIIGE